MIQYENRGTHTSQNIADPLLGFNSLSTWTSIGTGSASIFNTDYFHGSGCLKIQNTAWNTTDLTISNSVQATTILIDGEYDFSLYVKKELARDVDLTLEITQTQGGVSNVIYDATINMLTEDIDDWVSFITNNNFRLLAGDIITFRFGIPANTTKGISNVYVLVDGFHVFNKERKQLEAPIYTEPIQLDMLSQLRGEKGFGLYVDSLAIPTIAIETSWTEITIDALGSNVVDCLPLDIRGISDLISGGKIIPIASGDDYDGRLDLTIDSKSGSPTYLQVIIDFGASSPDTIRAFTGYIQTAKTPPFKQSLGLDFFAKDLFKANGGKIYARTDSGTFTISTRNIKLSRKSKRFI